jgi:hypothetical protein
MSPTLSKEFWEISDLTLKYELVRTFNKYGAGTEEADRFYFEELCQRISDELIYAMSAQNDLQSIPDQELQLALKEHTKLLTKVLFELLSVLYEPWAMKVIYDIMMAEDQDDIESRLFAIELLDNTLDEILKDKLTPIFEPTTFDQKIGNLQKFVPVEPMPVADALKNLLLADYKLINHHLKACCLRCYYPLTHDEQLLNAFKMSGIGTLKQMAEDLSKSNYSQRSFLKEMEDRFKLSSLQIVYLLNEGVVDNERGIKTKKAASHPYMVPMDIDGTSLLFDAYALSLFLEPNE